MPLLSITIDADDLPGELLDDRDLDGAAQPGNDCDIPDGTDTRRNFITIKREGLNNIARTSLIYAR